MAHQQETTGSGSSRPDENLKFNRKSQTEPTQTEKSKKLCLVQMYFDHFLSQPHDSVQFTVFIVLTESNQTTT